MLGSPIIDLAIGMVFIYLLLSLIASVLQEILASITQARAANLERGLHSLFSGDPLEVGEDGKPGTLFVDALYKHGLVRGLYQDPAHDSKGKEPPRPSALERFQLWFRRRLRSLLRITPPGYEAKPNDLLLPAYIPARTFSLALTDLLHIDKNNPDALVAIGAHLRELQRRNQVGMAAAKANAAVTPILQNAAAYENKAVEALQALLLDAGGQADKFQANLENWYNDSMDRASGWYKRYVQRILLILGLGIAVFFNVDSIHMARTLWFDRDTRQRLTDAADTYIKSNPTFAASSANGSTGGKPVDLREMKQNLQTTVSTFNDVGKDSLLPAGWRHRFPQDYWAGVQHLNPDLIEQIVLALIGWCLTASAISLGAPFWFDMLNKIMVVRNTVKPSEKSPNEKSKS